MSTRPQLRLPWLDLETTCLYPWEGEHAQVVEIAACVTNERLEIIDRYSAVVATPVPIQWDDLDSVVTEMHTASGLRAALDRGEGEHYDLALGAVTDLFDSHDCLAFGGYSSDTAMPLHGSTIQFDRTWLRHGPEEAQALDAALHYRTVDVSSIKCLFHQWWPDMLEGEPQSRKTHRGMEDLEDSINLLKFYMARIERGVMA